MTDYTFNDPCPHCGEPLRVDVIVIHNIGIYHASKVAKASCCGKGVAVHPVITYRATPYVGPERQDDWGRTFT